jgi:hypothetical protein
MKEPIIGEHFMFERKRLITKLDLNQGCDGCFFQTLDECPSDVACSGIQRKDDIGVIFDLDPYKYGK